MRIGFFTYGMDGERMTGIARYAVELTRALKRLEPSLDIVLLNPYPQSRHPWYREFETYPLPQLSLLPFAATLGNWQLHRAATELSLEHPSRPVRYRAFMIPTRRYKRVTSVRDAIPLIYPNTHLLTRTVFQTLVRATHQTADAVVTISEADAYDLEHRLGNLLEKLHITLLATLKVSLASEAEVAGVLDRYELPYPISYTSMPFILLKTSPAYSPL